MTAAGWIRDSLPTPAPLLSALQIAKLCPKIPALVPTWKTCGKPGCRCQRGELHGVYWSLRWREGPIRHRRYVRAADVPAVRAILEQRRSERHRQRLTYARSMHTWRGLDLFVAEVEAQLRAEREQP